MQCRFGFSPNIFRYFDHKEVFSRIAERAKDDRVRFCVERAPVEDKTRLGTLLAVTNPAQSAVHFDQLQGILQQYNAEGMSYENGIVRSTHKPKVGSTPFSVAGDEFMNQFVIDTPIDGYGRPSIYLSLLRMVCTNGAIAYDKAFRSELSTGKTDEDVAFSLVRAMDGFNNEDGFAALRNRFDTATRSWASVNETQKLYNTLSAQASRGNLAKQGRETNTAGQTIETSMPIFNAFHDMTGNIGRFYGLANIDVLSMKRQRTLPTACRVYDLLNFATEVATHRSNPAGAKAIQAFVGDIISHEYDLEGTVDQFSDFKDFFIKDEKAIKSLKEVDRLKNASNN
jgi:hypothetical protein